MYVFGIVVVVTISQMEVSLASSNDFHGVTRNSELLFVFMIHRHGDRTPEAIEHIKECSTNPEALIAAANYYGYGHLTMQGKQRSFRLGQFIRHRYDNFISPKFNDSEIYIESTAYARTRMTILTAMAAVFPPLPSENWSDLVNWEPVPYKSNDLIYDTNLAVFNCPTITKSIQTKLEAKPIVMNTYAKLLEKVSNLLNLDYRLQDYPLKIFFVHDVLRSQINLGIPLSPEIEIIFPEITQAAEKAIEYLINDVSTIDLMAGPLLKEFLDYSYEILNGDNTPRVRIYSAHDLNVYAFEIILQLFPKQGIPNYAALLSLELRRDAYGKVFILPVYLPTPEEEPLYLHVQGCDSVLCSLDQFTEILSPYTIDLNTWRTKCNWVDKL